MVDLKLNLFQFEFAGFYFRKIQDIINEAQQRVRRRFGKPRIAVLLTISPLSAKRSAMPMTPFNSVRISWLILARSLWRNSPPRQ